MLLVTIESGGLPLCERRGRSFVVVALSRGFFSQGRASRTGSRYLARGPDAREEGVCPQRNDGVRAEVRR